MPKLSSLYVELAANSAKLTSEFSKTNKRSKSWADSVSKNVNRVGVAFTAVGTIGAASMKSIYDANAPTIDRLGKLSDSITVQVKELQAYRLAAELAGVGTQAMDSSLERFNRRLGKAVDDGGAAAKSFKQLGLDAKAISESGMDNALSVVLDRLHEVEDANVRNGLAFDIFGEAGTKVMNLTSASIASAKAEISEFGIELSRVDVAQVEAANDAFTRVDTIVGAFGQKLTVQVAPMMQALAELFLENAKQAGGMGQVAGDSIDLIADGLGWIGDQLQNVQKGWGLLEYGFNATGQRVASLLHSLGLASAETVNEWTESSIEAYTDLQDLANRETFSLQFAEKLELARAKAAELGEEIAKVKARSIETDVDPNQFISGDITAGGNTQDDAANDETFYTAQIVAFQEYKASLQAGYTEIAESFRTHYDERYDILSAALERDAITQQQYDTQLHNVRLENERTSAAAIQSIRGGLTNNLIGLLSNLGSKQKIFAQLAVALEAKRALAENWQKTSVAAIQAYSSQLIPGDPTSYGRAAAAYTKTMSLGKLNAAIILANATLNASSAGGGASASAGSTSSSSADYDAGYSTLDTATGQTSSVSTQETNVYVLQTGSGEADPEAAREQLRELVDTGAVSISGSDVDNLQIQVV